MTRRAVWQLGKKCSCLQTARPVVVPYKSTFHKEMMASFSMGIPLSTSKDAKGQKSYRDFKNLPGQPSR